MFGFVDPKGSAKLEIVRLTGPPKEDKLAIQWAEVRFQLFLSLALVPSQA